MLATKPQQCIGFRLGLKKRGCTGDSYQLDYTDKISKYDEVVKTKDGKSPFYICISILISFCSIFIIIFIKTNSFVYYFRFHVINRTNL